MNQEYKSDTYIITINHCFIDTIDRCTLQTVQSIIHTSWSPSVSVFGIISDLRDIDSDLRQVGLKLPTPLHTYLCWYTYILRTKI